MEKRIMPVLKLKKLFHPSLVMTHPTKFKYVYGPIYSWRIGHSIGIDPISSDKKICNFNCCYCQLGPTTRLDNKRRDFISPSEIVEELEDFPKTKVDYYTFSGCGEPTLAKNLGAMIKAVKALTRGKVAVITNAGLIDKKEVQKDLLLADFVLVKVDAMDEKTFKKVSFPARGLTLKKIADGIKAFRKTYTGKLGLQIMFIDENKDSAARLAAWARRIDFDEIQINTPLRPSQVQPLSKKDIKNIEKIFVGLPVRAVFDAKKRAVLSVDKAQTVRRHGKH